MRVGSTRRTLGLLCALLLALAVGAAPAQASRTLLSEETVRPDGESSKIPDKEIEGACGVATFGGTLYVSDYYHHAVDVFGSATQILAQPLATDRDGPCGLAFDASGNLYVNYWHQGVAKAAPPYSYGAIQTFDSGESTGVAVDRASGDVYVDDRTHVAVYDPTMLDEEHPLQIIGAHNLEDAYGVAVSGGKVYVPDAADNTVKVFEPAVDPSALAAVIAGPPGGFKSLVDAAVAVDPTNQHLIVLDNLQPGFEHPEAAVDEFDSAGAYLGRPCRTANPIVDGEPSGLAFSGGNLYVTSGNSEEANLFSFGPFISSCPASAAPLAGPPAPSASRDASAPASSGAVRHTAKGPSASASEVVQRGNLRVSFDGSLSPHSLPRHEAAPVKVAVATKIAASDGGAPPQLRRIAIAINRNGHFSPRGLPVCRLDDIQPSTTANALKACRDSLVGEGSFSAKVLLSQQAPFPSAGKILAFNGTLHGKPAILTHVYGTDPVPTSYTFPFAIEPARGTFGTVLRASLPGVTGNSGYITGLSLSLGRSFSYRGRRRSYLSAACPAPEGFPGAVFPFARASFGFAGKTLTSTLTRSCGVRG